MRFINKINRIIFAFILLTTLIKCKKYPEGGLHLYANKNLIGKWKLEKYEVNDVDSTNLIITNNLQIVKENYFDIEYSKPSYSFAGFSGELLYRFRTDLSKKKTLIGGRIDGGITSVPLDSSHIYLGQGIYSRNILSPEGKQTEWKILKLNSKHLIIEHHSTKHYKIIFKNAK